MIGIFIPKIYFLLFGNILNYSNIYDFNSELKVIFITTSSYLIASLLVYLLPILNHKQKRIKKSKTTVYIYLFSIAVAIFFIIFSGGFSGLINYNNNILYYLTIFLSSALFLFSSLTLILFTKIFKKRYI